MEFKRLFAFCKVFRLNRPRVDPINCDVIVTFSLSFVIMSSDKLRNYVVPAALISRIHLLPLEH